MIRKYTIIATLSSNDSYATRQKLRKAGFNIWMHIGSGPNEQVFALERDASNITFSSNVSFECTLTTHGEMPDLNILKELDEDEKVINFCFALE